MRNLKKFLALVLAMVMAMSLMVTANAATKSSAFPDEDIDEHFVEAVDVLYGLKVFQGQNATGAEDGEKTFAPKASITRKEVAALMYRIFSTDVTDARAHLYKDYGDFTDVNSDAWYAGYVGLCANQEIIKGSNNGRFYPDENVTGYQVLAMILRMVGYDQNHEFEGSDWRIRVAGLATTLHITDNFNESNYDRTLNDPATREMVAELIFQTIVRVPMVTYNTLGYNDKTTVTSETFNPNLGWEKFGLRHEYEWSAIDKWGNPGYKWYTVNGHDDIETPGYAWLNGPMPATGVTTVATIKAQPTQYYDKANVRECDVSHDLGIEESETFHLFVNSNVERTDKYQLVATDTVTRVGGQGRETNFYYKISSPFAGALDPWCTMVDTYLAKVTRVTEVVLDHNQHVVQKARLELDVYDRAETMSTANRATQTTGTPLNFINNDTYNTRCTDTTVGPKVSTHVKEQNTNFTYAAGDYLLVRGYTDASQGRDNGGYTAGQAPTNTNTGLNHTLDQEAIEKMAFETNMLGGDDTKLEIVKPAPVVAVQGKQSTVTWNNGTHVVGGETKDDQLTLFMDYAGRNLDNTFSWYYDQFGNLIGIGPVADNVKYGIITSLYSAFDQGTSATTGTTKAMAEVTYSDGGKGTVAISKFYMSGDTTSNIKVANGEYDADMTYDTNTVALTPVYDYNTGNTVMAAVPDTNATDNYAAVVGNLMVAPVASINKNADTYINATENVNSTVNHNHFGIIGFNMFKFITSEAGVVTAVEIGGGAPDSATADNDNDLFYKGHHNLVTNGVGKLNKAQGNITVDFDSNYYDDANAAQAIWLNSNVEIILNVGGTPKTYTLSTLPSDVTIKAGSEIDWVDTNGDLRADYVYLFGETTGTVTYGMFYYNGGPATWNGTTGTLSGWLNGEDATITFDDEDEFKLVQNSQGYLGHLFALRFMDNVVEDVMIAKNTDGKVSIAAGAYLLYDEPDDYVVSGISTGSNKSGVKLAAGWDVLGSGPDVTDTTVYKSGTTTVFGLGSVNAAYGNKYDANTEAIYLKDGGANGEELTYTRNALGNQFFGTVTANANAMAPDGGGTATTYYVSNSTVIRGIGMGVTYGEAVLYYLQEAASNDVTIIYDSTTMAILEIYVATDPDVTPSGNPVRYTSTGAIAMDSTTLNASSIRLHRNGDDIDFSTGTHNITFTVTLQRNVGGTWVDFGTYTINSNGKTGYSNGSIGGMTAAASIGSTGSSWRVDTTVTGSYRTAGGVTYNIGTITLPTQYITQ